MEKTSIKMLKDFGKDYVAGQSYTIDSETADVWVKAGLCVESNPENDFADRLVKSVESLVKESVNQAVKVPSSPPSVKMVEDEADKQKSFGHFTQLVAKACAGSAQAKEQLAAQYKSTLQVGDGELGGYTIPEQLLSTLNEMPGYPTNFGDSAIEISVTGESVKVPSLDQSVTPDGEGQTSWDAGLNVYWADELDDAQETNFKFRQIELKPNRLTAYMGVGNHFMRVSPLGVDAIVRRKFVSAVGRKTEYAYLFGDGVAKPLGMLTTGNGVVKSVSRNTASHIKWADACNMWAALPVWCHSTAIWLVSQPAFPDLLQMTTDNGTNVFHPQAQAGVNMALFTRPVYICEFLPTLGTAKDLCLVDPAMYYKGVSQQPTIAVSEHVRFLKDETVFRIDFWGDGAPGINYLPKLGDGVTTVSPAVYLGAAQG